MCKKVFPFKRAQNAPDRFHGTLFKNSRQSAKRAERHERKKLSRINKVHNGRRRETFDGQVVILVKKGANT